MSKTKTKKPVMSPAVAEVLEKMRTHSEAGKHWAEYIEGKGAEDVVKVVEDVLGCCLVLQTAAYRDLGHKL